MASVADQGRREVGRFAPVTPEEQRWEDRLRYAESMLARNRRQRRALGARYSVDHYASLRHVARQWLDQHRKVQP